MDKKVVRDLIEVAKRFQKNSYSPYSKYPVGASVLGESGRIYGGCNVENVSFGLSVCAERIAIFNAISGGERRIKGICIVARSASPCGACRQVIMEFADKDCDVICLDYDPIHNKEINLTIHKLSKLLYRPFTPKSFEL